MVNNTYCIEQCFFGDEGHCSRSKREYESHCEKRYNDNKPQRVNRLNWQKD